MTEVEFTVHCQTRLQSKFKGTVDSCPFLTIIKDANLWGFFILKCSGDIIISYMEYYAIFCTRIDFRKIFVMSLNFSDVKNNKIMSNGMIYRTH